MSRRTARRLATEFPAPKTLKCSIKRTEPILITLIEYRCNGMKLRPPFRIKIAIQYLRFARLTTFLLMVNDFPAPQYMPLDFLEVESEEQAKCAAEFLELLERRRTVHEYSDRDVQPWRFVVVRDAEVKKRIREAAESGSPSGCCSRPCTTWASLR